MKKEVMVSKELAETLKEKRLQKEQREFLLNLILLEKASQPINKNGKLVITETASKARILLEVMGYAFSVYRGVWKEIVDLKKDWPDVVDDVYSSLSKNEWKDLGDDEAITALERYITEMSALLEKAKKLKAELNKSDESIKTFAASISPGADVATPTEIDMENVETPQDINPQNQVDDDESKAKIGVEDL